ISPVATHPTWFKEKSGGDAFCCAATPGASAAQTKPVKTLPAGNRPLEKRMDIVPSCWAVRCRSMGPAYPSGCRASFRRDICVSLRRPVFANKPQFTVLRLVSHAAKRFARRLTFTVLSSPGQGFGKCSAGRRHQQGQANRTMRSNAFLPLDSIRCMLDAWGPELHTKLQHWRSAMKVKDAMHKGVEWVGPDTPVVELAKLMCRQDIGAVPIGENDRLIGMVTDRDIVCKGLA